MAQKLHPRTAGLSFTAALLQDLAIPLLVERWGSQYEELLRAWHGAEGELPVLETETFGWTHADVANWLCTKWEIPTSLKLAIAGHHEAEVEDVPPAVTLVGLLSERLQAPEIEPIVETARDRVGLAADTTREVLEEAFEQADDLARMLVG